MLTLRKDNSGFEIGAGGERNPFRSPPLSSFTDINTIETMSIGGLNLISRDLTGDRDRDQAVCERDPGVCQLSRNVGRSPTMERLTPSIRSPWIRACIPPGGCKWYSRRHRTSSRMRVPG